MMRLTRGMLDVMGSVMGWADAAGYEEIVQTMPEKEQDRFLTNAEKARWWLSEQQDRRDAKKKVR